ncbi:Protein RICE SALT SENSITIVE 3 [Glycine soja]
MVGSGTTTTKTDRSKEAVGMMALHEALRSVCLNSDWTYSVFWTIRPRPRVRGGNGCKVGDENGSLMLMWEDGFCRGRLPPEWIDQFESGIQTIAVIQAGHGLLQLGSCKIIPEDLHFVLRMRHTFESLGYQSGFYLSQLFSSTRSTSSSTSIPSKPSTIPIRPPPPLLNWGQRPLESSASMLSSPTFQHAAARMGFPEAKDETHMFLMPHASSEQLARMGDIMGEHENDIKWPNGLSIFNALTGRSDDAKLLFNQDSLGAKPSSDHNHRHTLNPNPNVDSVANPNEFLSLDGHTEGRGGARKVDKFKRCFTLPARIMTSSSSSTSMDHHQQQAGVEYRNSEGSMYQDVMETFLE